MTSIILHYWQPALFAFFCGFVFTWLAVKFFPKWGLKDRPHLYGIDRPPIAYYGGLAIFLAFIFSVLFFVPLTDQLISLLLAATLIMLLGFFDDLLNLPPILRIVGQFIAALILVSAGIGIFSINIPFFGLLDLDNWLWNSIPVLSAAFTIVWVMVILNTMNFVDGVSGLTSGVSFVAGFTIFLLSVNPLLHENPASQAGVATLSLIISMLGLAFLIFDFPKPRILMGDSGSTFFGFMLAGLAIFSGGKVATAFLVLGIPILDMIWVVLRRFFSGQKIWKGDLKHLHHRLLDLGLSHRKVVLLYLGATAVLGLTSVQSVSSQQKLYIMVGLLALMLILALFLIRSSMHRRFNK